MIGSLKAEFRKLFTVRSTYIILALCLAVEFLFAFYVDGIKTAPGELLNPNHLLSEITNAVTVLATPIAIVGVLLMTHEYRYNTILYTLSSGRNRTQVLLAKILAVSIFAIVFTAIFAAMAPLLAWLGVTVKGHHLAHQVGPSLDLILRTLFVGWGFSMLALILSSLIRIQVGALAAIFLIPGTLEQLLGLALKSSQDYLPFSSLNAVVVHANVSYGKAVLIACVWIGVGWLIAWQAFLRRDAS